MSDEESVTLVAEPPKTSYEQIVATLQEAVRHCANGSTGSLWDLDDTVRVANPEGWSGAPMTGETMCMVLNNLAIPSEYVHEHPELLNYQIGYCRECNKYPCYLYHEWVADVWENAIDVLAGRDYSTLDNEERKKVRFPLYRGFYRIIHGIGQKRKREPLPECVVNRIKETYPDPDGYVGFRPVADATAGEE
jgi:hypothetical protein